MPLVTRLPCPQRLIIGRGWGVHAIAKQAFCAELELLLPSHQEEKCVTPRTC